MSRGHTLFDGTRNSGFNHGTRHRFWVQSGDMAYRLDADIFGWVCRTDPSVSPTAHPLKAKDKRPPHVPAAATSYVEAENLAAYTLADSFRVRILTPSRRSP